MFSSSNIYTSDACSSPIVVPHEYYYHHLDQQEHHQLIFQESDHFQNPNPIHDEANEYVLPIESTITPLDKSKAIINMDSESAEAVTKKIKKKADKRSKVRTAQGLRDRRVRMSIGIARKFFDLQDLLGFDKPSRTLDWLLTNSNKAILELSAAASSPSTSSDQATAVVKTHEDSDHKTLSCNGSLKSSKKQNAALLAKESRAKARARARARTVAKLFTSNLNQQKNRLLNTPEDMMSSDHQTYFGSMHLNKSVEYESQKEEERTIVGDHLEQHTQNQQLQLQNYDSVIKSYHHWNELKYSNLSLDQWDIINCTYPQQGSSAAYQLNFSRDYNIIDRARAWDI